MKFYKYVDTEGFHDMFNENNFIFELPDDYKPVYEAPFKHNGKIYSAICSKYTDNVKTDIVVEELNLDFKNTENSWEYNITCPICGYEDEESYDHSPAEETYVCPICGAVLELEIDYVTYYSTKVITPPNIPEV